MKFIKSYKHKYKIMTDGRDDYLCLGKIKVKLEPHNDPDFYIEGYDLTQAERVIKYALNKKQGPYLNAL